MDAATLSRVADELRTLEGARVQRVDVLDRDELVVELRIPGRTHRLLISARPGFERFHLVTRRPGRVSPGGTLQNLLRKRLVGRPVSGFGFDGRVFSFSCPGTKLSAMLFGKGRGVFIEDDDGAKEHFDDFSAPDEGALSLNQRLAAELEPTLEADRRARLLLEWSRSAARQRKKLTRLISKLRADRTRLSSLAQERTKAELLKTQLSKAPRGTKTLTVRHWETSEEVSIDLDPALDAKANMQRLFARAKKGDRGLPIVERRLAEIEARVADLDAKQQKLEALSYDELVDLLPTRDRGVAGAPAKRDRKRDIDRWGHRFVSKDGAEIRVGKGAKENDRLTFAAARGHDMWLHARGTSGAHVVVFLEKGTPIREDTLLDAAHLAVHFSGARQESKAEVIYTEAKHVKNVRGAAGRVTVAKERTLMLRVEPARLARLLGQKQAGHG